MDYIINLYIRCLGMLGVPLKYHVLTHYNHITRKVHQHAPTMNKPWFISPALRLHVHQKYQNVGLTHPMHNFHPLSRTDPDKKQMNNDEQ